MAVSSLGLVPVPRDCPSAAGAASPRPWHSAAQQFDIKVPITEAPFRGQR
jgi:hypothetical protein